MNYIQQTLKIVIIIIPSLQTVSKGPGEVLVMGPWDKLCEWKAKIENPDYFRVTF